MARRLFGIFPPLGDQLLRSDSLAKGEGPLIKESLSVDLTRLPGRRALICVFAPSAMSAADLKSNEKLPDEEHGVLGISNM